MSFKMKKLSGKEISHYLEKIELETMLKYGVYQIEGLGKICLKKLMVILIQFRVADETTKTLS